MPKSQKRHAPRSKARVVAAYHRFTMYTLIKWDRLLEVQPNLATDDPVLAREIAMARPLLLGIMASNNLTIIESLAAVATRISRERP